MFIKIWPQHTNFLNRTHVKINVFLGMKKACFKLCAFSLFYEQQNFYNPTEMRFYCCLVRESVYALEIRM